jgi:hypothetical protein
VLLSASLAFAGHHYHGKNYMMPSWDMNEMDGDRDGKLTFDEFSRTRLEQLRTGYNMIDTNNDGLVDANEWNDFLNVHGVKTN